MTDQANLTYWGFDAVLADGATVHIRPITPEDAVGLVDLHGRLSETTIYRRFFSAHPKLTPAEVQRFTEVDYQNRMALVASLRGSLIAIARYERTSNSDAAEVAFVVDDAHQGRGLGTLLLEHLAAYARSHGIQRFVAETLPDNRPMLEVFRRAGFAEKATFEGGVIRVSLDIEPNEATVAAIEGRWRVAAARSIERLLRPRSVAVIGASRRRGTIGHEVFRNLIAGGFQGPVYPVHPDADHIASVRAYPDVLAVPGDVDLAVIVVPAEQVPAVVAQCATKGVNGLVVISAGFAETGVYGAAVQRDLVIAARGAGMRLIGPNCMGVFNTSPDVSLNATFAPIPPRRGRVAFSSQSGGLGIAVLEEAERRDLGISSFVSVGNKADVSGNDLLLYWETDDATDVILLYLESFGNPRRFARVAKEVSRVKPIVALKAGRSQAGSRAAMSHTAALANPDTAVDALFAQTGVIRVDTLEELFGVASVLATQPLPAGNRVAIVGNAGGPGILAADACEGAGLEVPELRESTQNRLRSFLPAAAGVRNPVDMVASASADHYQQAVSAALEDDTIDAVLVVFTPPLVTQADDVAAAIARAALGAPKPVITNFLAMTGSPEALRFGDREVPSFAFPESAARALARAHQYAAWRRRPAGTLPALDDVNPIEARAAVQAALTRAGGPCWLDQAGVSTLLGCYGVSVAPVRLVSSADGAADAAVAIGFPVALKAGAPELVHKSDVGAVRLGLTSAEEVRQAFTEIAGALGDRMGGAVVQAMVDPGVETIVGVVHERSFGPLIMFGSGGTAVELFADRSFRVLPLTDLDAGELVRSVKGSALLFGYRGSAQVDVEGLEQLLLRVSRLADDIHEITEMDLNPVVVSSGGAVVVDAKVHLSPLETGPDPLLRRLR